MRNIRLEEHEMKVVHLTREQVLLALRNYMKGKVIPPRDAKVEIFFVGGGSEDLRDLQEITLTWSECSVDGV